MPRAKRRYINMARRKSRIKNYNKIVVVKKRGRERFIPTTTTTISDLRKKVLEMQGELALALRSGNKERTEKLIQSIPKSKMVREWAVYRTISSQGARTKGLSDKTRPVTNKAYQDRFFLSQLWHIVKEPLLPK